MPHIAGHLPVPYGMATGLGSLGPDKLGREAGLSAIAAQQAYDPGGAYGREAQMRAQAQARQQGLTPFQFAQQQQLAGNPNYSVTGRNPAGSLASPVSAPGAMGTSFLNVPQADPNAAAFGLSGAEDILTRGALTGLDLLGQTFDVGERRFDAGAQALGRAQQQGLGIAGGTLTDINRVLGGGVEGLGLAGGGAAGILTGARQELGGAGGLASGILTGARQGLGGAGVSALEALSAGQGQLTDVVGQGTQALGGGEQRGLAEIRAGQSALGGIIGQGVSAIDPLTRFVGPGQQAGDVQAALSGALGAAAQAQAFQDFQASPGQAFLQGEGERAILRNAAAIGGLGGGNLQRELARYGQGLSLQDLERQTQQLSDVAGRGVTAAGTGADIVSRLRGQQAGLGSQLAQAASGIPLATAAQEASLRGQQAGLGAQLAQAQAGVPLDVAAQQAALSGQQAGLGVDLAGRQAALSGQQAGLGVDVAGRQAGVLGQQAGLTAGVGQFGANLVGDVGSQLANLRRAQAGQEMGLGQFAATIPTGIGRNMADLRTQAGRDIATQIGTTSSALADLASTQGAGLSDLTGGQAQQISGLIASATSGDVNARIELGRILANLAAQQGSSAAGVPIITPATTSTLGQVGQLATGIGGMLGSGAFDPREPAPVTESTADFTR